MNDTYIVYVKTDENANIAAVNSSAFLTDTSGWVQIDEGTGDRFVHAQGNYFDNPIMTIAGIYRYRLVDGAPVEKTPEEVAAEEAALPPAPPTTDEIIASFQAENQALAESVSGAQEQTLMLAETVDAILTNILPALLGI